MNPPAVEREELPDMWIYGAVFLGALVVSLAAAAFVHPFAGVIGLPIALYGFRVIQRPVLAAYAAAALVPVTSGFARGFPVPGLRISEVIVVAAFGLVMVVRGDRIERWRPLDTALAVYAATSVVLGGFSAVFVADSMSGLSTLFFPAQFFLLFLTIRMAVDDDHDRRRVLALVLAGVVPVGLLAAAQQLDVFGARGLVQEITAGEIFDTWSYTNNPRATGPFDGWHPLAGYVFIPILLGVGLIFERAQRVLDRRWLVAITLVGLGALALSQTLNVLATMVVGGLALGVMSGRSRVAVEWLVVLILAITVLFGSAVFERIDSQLADAEQAEPDTSLPIPGTIAYRFDVWQEQFFPSIQEHWSTGYGPELPPEISWRHTESIYITLLLRGGLPLLLTFIWLMTETWRAARAVAHESPDPALRVAGQVLMVVVLLLIPMHAVYPYLSGSGMSQVLWVVAAVVASALDGRSATPNHAITRVPEALKSS